MRTSVGVLFLIGIATLLSFLVSVTFELYKMTPTDTLIVGIVNILLAIYLDLKEEIKKR